jgi:hypothetical protein
MIAYYIQGVVAMFIYIKNILVNFSLVDTIKKEARPINDNENEYLIVLSINGNDRGWRFPYSTEQERDKAFSDLLKWAGTINPNNMIP